MFWKDEQVINWAKLYTSKAITLMEMERSIQAPHSTVWWCFQHRLPKLDVALYDKTLERIDYNKRHKGGRKHV